VSDHTIRARLDVIAQCDYLSLEDAALLVHVSKATIRRRLDRLDVLRDGRVVRVRRLSLLRLFHATNHGSEPRA